MKLWIQWFIEEDIKIWRFVFWQGSVLLGWVEILNYKNDDMYSKFVHWFNL